MYNLSERLRLIVSFVPQGVSVCDVGTDHGYLPAALCLSGKFKSVTATDIREKPLLNAKSNIEKLGANGVELILCDGLEKVSREKADCVIIAGMGGEVISGIIDRCSYKESPLFILEPMTDASTLRTYLAKNGFNVLYETAITENKKIYSVMLCKFDGVTRSLTEAQKRIGILKPDKAANTAYIDKQYGICQKCIAELENAGKKTEVYFECLAAIKEIENIKEK